MTWVRISIPRINSDGHRVDKATRSPPKPQPMSAMVMGFDNGFGSPIG